MSANSFSQKVSKLSESLEELQTEFISNPASAPEILSNALESLHSCIEDLSEAEKVIKCQNAECTKYAEESTDALTLAHELQVHQIELKMQKEELERAKLVMNDALAKYSDLYDFAPIGLFTLDENRQILEINVAGADLLGMKKSDLLNRRFELFIAERDRQSFVAFCKSAFETSAKQTCELCLLGDEVPTIYARIEGTATEDRSRNRKQFRIAIIDITESKKAEDALRHSKEHQAMELSDTKLLQDISSMLIQRGDTKDLYEKILDAAIAIMHSDYASLQMLSPERGIGGELHLLAFRGFSYQAAKFWEWVNIDSKSTCGIALHTGQRAIVPNVEDSSFLAGSKDQTMYLQTGIHAVQTTPLISRKGQLVGMISTHWCTPHEPSERDLGLLDILARQAADLIEHNNIDKALQESEQKFKAIADASQAAITLYQDGHVVYANKASEAIFGYSLDERSRMKLRDLLHPDYLEKAEKRMKALLKGESALSQNEYKIVRKDGEERWVLSTGSKIAYNGNAAVMTTSVDITDCKRMDEALKESEEKYRTIVETANEGIIMVDAKSLTTYVNDEFAKMIGYKPEELIGKDITDYFDREHLALALAKREQRRQYGTRNSYESKLIRKDGSPLWIIVNSSPLLDNNGKFVGSLGLVTDITEREKAEEALRENRTVLKTIIESTPDYISLKDREGRYVMLNSVASERLSQSTGLPAAEIIGKKDDEILPSETARPVMDEDRRVIASGKMRALDQLFTVGNDLRSFSTIKSPYHDASGNVVGVVNVSRDITDRKQYENALRESEEKFRALANAAHNAIIVLRDNRLLYANPVASSISGYTNKELLEMEFINLIHPDCKDIVKDGIKARMGGNGKPGHYEVRIIKKTGEERWLDILTNLISYGGSPAGIATCMDITERKEAELKLVEATKKAEQNQLILDAIIQQMPVGVIITDASGSIAKNNEAMDRIWKREMLPTENIENHGYRAFHPDGSEYLPDEWPLTRALKREEVTIGEEMSILRGDGTKAIVNASSTPIKDSSGKLIAGVVVDVDITKQKQMENELRNARDELEHKVKKRTAELETIYKSAPVGLCVLGTDTRFLRLNEAFAETDGLSIDEHIGKTVRELNPDLANAAEELARKVVETGEPVLDIEIQGETNAKPGVTRYWMESWLPLKDNHGQVKAINIVAKEITERKRAEEKLRKQAFMLDSVGDAVIGLDMNYQINYWNSSAEKMYGYSVQEVLGRTSLEILKPEYPGMTREEVRDRIVSKGQIKVESIHYAKDGHRISVELHSQLLYDNEDKPSGLLGIVRDITERKRAEEKLREQTEMLDLAHILVRDMDSRIIFWNKGAEKLYGFTKAEAIGNSSHELLQTKIPRPLTDINAELLQEGHWEGELTHIKKDGTSITVASHWELYRDCQGKPAAIIEVNNDITERKMVENDLVKAKEAAEAAAKAKAAFMSNMSHELRTPMNYVIGATSLLLDEPLAPELIDLIETIKKGSDEMMALINNILSFSEVEKKKVALEYQPLNIRALIDNSLKLVASQAIKKGLNIASSITYGTPDNILGDYGKLMQVLSYILSNAIKFTDQGDISLSVSSKHIEGNKHEFLFTVRDTGIGIPLEKMSELFQPFSQVETTLSRKRDGAGMGLAICRGLVELMGGKIWVKSEIGKGSTFYFTIEAEIVPNNGVKPAAMQDEAIETTWELAEQHPLRILVAEDDPSNQKVIVQMLSRMGYGADSVADGMEVLQALEKRPYDVILMDIKMPSMDGITAAKEIRRIWPNNGPKIIALTAYALAGDKERCLEAGMDDYIAKPMKMAYLAEALKRCSLKVQ